jgi:hypothetical protein
MSDIGYFEQKQAFNASQGYRIDYKYLGMAYFIEVAVVITSLLSAWFFAKIYGHGDGTTMAMMMLAPIAYAGVEIARVPLALALRTQPNWFWKLVFGLMVLCAVAVSVKSLSQLGEVMFRPRLIDVTHATIALKDAQAAQASYAGKVGAADAVVKQRGAELDEAEARLKSVNTELGALPPDKCTRVWHNNSQGRRFTSQECHTDGRQKVMAGNLADAEAARADASAKLDAARKVRDGLDATATAKTVSDLELARRDAIMNSQLHSFTGMFFGKDPTEVTEGELHSFLRIFVFFPAIFASLAATALALASVTPLRKPESPVEIDDIALVDHLLGPLTKSLDEHARYAANDAVARAMVGQRIEPAAPDLQPAATEPPPADVKPEADEMPKPQPMGPMRPTLVASAPPPGAA